MDLKKLVLEENVGGYDLLVEVLRAASPLPRSRSIGCLRHRGRWLVALIAVIGLFSGMTRHCTPYALLGISTKRS